MDSASLRTRVTSAARAADTGDPVPVDVMVDLIYDELRAIAHRHLARERPGHTLQTTALVHEAYMKLVDGGTVGGRGRAYFFAAAGRAMRQVLVDHARRRKAAKRGGGQVPVPLDDVQVAADAWSCWTWTGRSRRWRSSSPATHGSWSAATSAA